MKYSHIIKCMTLNLSDILKIQKPKMKELWDNEKDEAWENA